MNLETPLHKAQGLGASHSGVGHFWKQRVSAVALIPLTLWFLISVVGLVGLEYADVLIFLNNPVNAILMAAFVVLSLYHMTLGLEEVIIDYIPQPGLKLTLMLANWAFAIGLAAISVISLLTIIPRS
jgi:succinate dehydrogenase / fumarate reductase, membrane anchor subunit